MEKFEINPFDRSALTDIKLLAGRNAEFTRIRFVLRSAFMQKNRVRSILITGDRGVGKTSFLNLIEKECPQYNLIPIRLNLTESNSANSNEFFWYLFNQLLNKVLKLDFYGGLGGIVDSTIQKILHSDGSHDLVNHIFKTPLIRKNYLANNHVVFEFDQLIEDITKIRQEITELGTQQFNLKTKFMFLVDESQKIYSNSKIIEDIRYIIQHESIGAGFVFAGDQTYSEQIWEKVFGGSHREFEIINLNYFEDSISVQDYFFKSLDSIGWSTKEIETDLFYKYKDTCYQIFKLTSGKPAWINIIAMKMFERCMLGETRYLVFDRQAKTELKEILEESGQLEKNKLDFIEKLDPVYEKWLSLLFFCELSTFEQVYFYGKFILVDENEITLTAFEGFCKTLVEKRILHIVNPANDKTTIGFKNKTTDYLDNKFLAFSPENDAMKQWLAISTEGRFTFNFSSPSIWFIIQVYKVIAIDSDKFTTRILASNIIDDPSQKRFSDLQNRIHYKNYDIEEATYSEVLNTYEFIKKSSISKNRKVLFAYLNNCKSGKYHCWNVYHYYSDGKLGDYWESKTKFPRFIQNVEKHNNEEQRFEFNLFLDDCPEISMEHYQKLLIKSKDRKKIGILIDDKLEELVDDYISKKDPESAMKKSEFFYDLFQDGFDLNINCLNNSAYVFCSKLELDKAEFLIKEAKHKFKTDMIDVRMKGVAPLVLYNYAILHVYRKKHKEAIDQFKEALSFVEHNPDVDITASIMRSLKLTEQNEIEIEEIWADDSSDSSLNVKELINSNIELLEKFLTA